MDDGREKERSNTEKEGIARAFRERTKKCEMEQKSGKPERKEHYQERVKRKKEARVRAVTLDNLNELLKDVGVLRVVELKLACTKTTVKSQKRNM